MKQTVKVHPLFVRATHWINAAAILIMIGSGWKIYEDEVLFGWLHFPDWITIGGEAQGALQWHFLGMWILVLNGLGYIIYVLATGRFRHMLLPIYPSALIADIRAQTQIAMKGSDFKLETLPAHLFMNFKVIDEHGRQLAMGRNLAQLRAELGGQPQQIARRGIGMGLECYKVGGDGFVELVFAGLDHALEVGTVERPARK